jgi:hypothetical protein
MDTLSYIYESIADGESTSRYLQEEIGYIEHTHTVWEDSKHKVEYLKVLKSRLKLIKKEIKYLKEVRKERLMFRIENELTKTKGK